MQLLDLSFRSDRSNRKVHASLRQRDTEHHGPILRRPGEKRSLWQRHSCMKKTAKLLTCCCSPCHLQDWRVAFKEQFSHVTVLLVSHLILLRVLPKAFNKPEAPKILSTSSRPLHHDYCRCSYSWLVISSQRHKTSFSYVPACSSCVLLSSNTCLPPTRSLSPSASSKSLCYTKPANEMLQNSSKLSPVF